MVLNFYETTRGVLHAMVDPDKVGVFFTCPVCDVTKDVSDDLIPSTILADDSVLNFSSDLNIPRSLGVVNGEWHAGPVIGPVAPICVCEKCGVRAIADSKTGEYLYFRMTDAFPARELLPKCLYPPVGEEHLW